MIHHIHIFGASGSGTSTLGRQVAAAICGRYLDSDDYYWIETDPPFATARDSAVRLALIERDMTEAPDWVVSGSICGWGDPLVRHFTLAVFLYLDPVLRMGRILERGRLRYGSRIQPGGDMHAQHLAFLDWARSYDGGRAPARSLDLHERWMRRLTCPIMRLDSSRPSGELVDEILRRTAVQ